MPRLILTGLLGLALWGAAPAGAVEDRFTQGTTLVSDGMSRPQPYQRWVDRAAVPTPPTTVTLVRAACPGYEDIIVAGCMRDGVVWLTPDIAGREDLLHELGHLFDAILGERLRKRFQAIMRDSRPWAPPIDNITTRVDENYAPPNEHFAEAYAACALRLPAWRMWFSYGYEPTRSQHRAVCTTIRRFALQPTRG